MLHACVRKFDVMDTIGNFYETKQGLNLVKKMRNFSTSTNRLGQTACDCPGGRGKESELEQSSHGLVHADQVCW